MTRSDSDVQLERVTRMRECNSEVAAETDEPVACVHGHLCVCVMCAVSDPKELTVCCELVELLWALSSVEKLTLIRVCCELLDFLWARAVAAETDEPAAAGLSVSADTQRVCTSLCTSLS